MNQEKPYNSSSVLIVDDNIKNLQILGGFLQKEGLFVEFALNGRSALGWLEKKKFDIVLLDIMMPEMDGFEVCKEIKKNKLNGDIPVIFITAKTDTESIVKGFETGAVDYITKPFIQSELLARVRTHLNIQYSKEQITNYLHEIEERNKNIRSSIEYARNIQKAVLSTTEINLKYLPEYFVLNRSKDILSGDFYWIKNLKEQVIFTVMDCTGHGVPGALMSILTVTLLNETIVHGNIFQPDKILENLRTKLILSLGQNQGAFSVKDGIEGSVINYHPETGILQFAGTHKPAILIHNHEISEIMADKIPIGFFEKPANFTLKTINITRGDILYLFTDGYVDQFGGPDTKKIMSGRFRELLIKYHDLPLETQKTKLLEYLLWWQKEVEQTDDILVLGIKF